MKRFNVSILAVVAVLAIGLTAFTKAEPAAKLLVPEDCYTAVTTVCQSPNISLVFDQTACLTAQNQFDKPIQALGGYQETIDCQTQTNEFCCAQLVKIESALCLAQPRIDFVDLNGVSHTNSFAKIAAVYCRP